MPTVAEQLRNARETRKITIPQAAETTKIRTDHLRALEDGQYDIFSAPVYIRGFVRSYATLLKLDVGQIMADLDDELSGTKKFRQPPPLSELPPKGVVDFATLQLSRLNWRLSALVIGVAVVVLVVVGLVAAWRSHRTADPLADLPPAVYKPASSGDTLPLKR